MSKTGVKDIYKTNILLLRIYMKYICSWGTMETGKGGFKMGEKLEKTMVRRIKRAVFDVRMYIYDLYKRSRLSFALWAAGPMYFDGKSMYFEISKYMDLGMKYMEGVGWVTDPPYWNKRGWF